VKFAREHGLALAVKGGGHSLAGHSVVDDGLVIDLSAMRGVTIDQRKKTARVQGGATSGDLAGPAHAYGLAVSTGDTSSVGLGGLVTGGGIGWMARKHGLAIDNLLSAQVVTADGEILRVSRREHADLFWAIRGGGGNFGVVTEFEFQMWKDGSVLGGAIVLPATPEVLRGYAEYALEAPDELTTIGLVMQAPPAPFIRAGDVGKMVLMIKAVYAGHPVWGERALAPLRALAAPLADTVAHIPYPVMFNYTAAAAEPGLSSVRATFADAMSEAIAGNVIAAVDAPCGPLSMVQIRPLGGAMARVAPEATAFAHRDKPYLIAAINVWEDPAEDPAPHEAWTERSFAALRAEGSGAYSNFLADEGQNRVREAYSGGAFARLACVKSKYDPENIFHNNQNIRPAANAGERAA
jgi:FAD/FMN-containing dehydrogenase